MVGLKLSQGYCSIMYETKLWTLNSVFTTLLPSSQLVKSIANYFIIFRRLSFICINALSFCDRYQVRSIGNNYGRCLNLLKI